MQPIRQNSTNSEKLVIELLEIMKQLRDKDNGCPWDKQQTFETISKYTIEEAYEVVEAINNKDWENLKEELGDLLLQVVYHSEIAKELGMFEFHEVVKNISTKMISRHPHIFGSKNKKQSPEQQIEDWEKIKDIEKKKKTNNKGYLLDNIPKALPALIRAEKLQKKAAKIKFDWVETKEVLDKINEESLELVNSIEKLSQAKIEEELGDILFTIVNLSRKLKVDPEKALNKTNEKFIYRLNGIEDELFKLGKSVNEVDQDLLETLWEAQKN